MKRSLFCVIAAAALSLALSSSATAGGFFQRAKGGPGAVVTAANLTPGSNAGGAGWALFTPPAALGTPGDDGYADVAEARLDREQHPVLRTGESMRLGVVVRHIPTLAEFNAGKNYNQCEVDFWVDGGPMVAVTSETVNPDTNILDFNVNIREADFPVSGKHEVRWKAVPCTGIPLIGQGEYQPGQIGTHFSGGGGAISGTTLTATSYNAVPLLKVGDSVIGPHVLPNTFITADCGGAGGDGCYTVNQSQTVAQEYMEVRDAPSFVFYTSRSNAIPQRIIYVSTTGNDTTGNGTSANPFATLVKAVNPGFGSSSTEEWFFCMMAGTHQITGPGAGGGGAGMWNLDWWAHIQPSSKAPCNGTGAGTVNFDATVGAANNNNLGMARTVFDGVNILKSRGISGDNNFGGTGAARIGSEVAIKNGTFTGIGFNAVDDGVGGGSSGLYCINIQVSLTGNGCNSGVPLIIANSTFDYISVDVLSNGWFVYGNTISHHGPWPATGNTVAGSNIVTGLTEDTSKWAVGSNFGTASNAPFPQNLVCDLPYTYTVTAILSPSSLQINANAATTVTGERMGAICGHPDVLQEEFGRYNVIAANNDASAATNYAGRGIATNGTPSGQFMWAITDNKFAEAGGAYAWQWGVGSLPMISVLFAGNQITGLSSLDPATTYTRVYHLNNTCTGAPTHPAGTIFRGGTC